ncbi:MAG: hypothetical protein CMP47_02535 [Rickettsiales bacterium]|nr:hypothetical protein [Rickettsiales bacterium]
MSAFVIGFFIASIIADEILFRAIERESVKLYKSLGCPSWFATMWNPVVIFKVICLLLLPSSFKENNSLQRKLWISRLLNLGLIASIVVKTQMN